MKRSPNCKPMQIIGNKARVGAVQTTRKEKIEQRARIDEDVEAFLASGGKIERPPLEDRTMHKPRFNARISGGETFL